MIKKFEINENLIAMAAFTKIVKKYYTDMGANRSPEVISKFKKAMINPEHFCRLDFDVDDVQRKYASLKIVKKFDPYAMDADVIQSDILDAFNELDELYKGDTPAVNAGRFLEMLDDKVLKYYKIGDFAPNCDDAYFRNVLEEKLTHHKPHKDDDSGNTDNVQTTEDVDKIDKLAEKVKDKILSEIMAEIPKAMEKVMFTNAKNVK